MFLGQDCHTSQHKAKVEAAYHTELFEQFIERGLREICNMIGLEGDPYDWWKVHCTLETSPEGSLSHCYLLKAKKDIHSNNFNIKAGQLFEFFRSHKSLPKHMRRILRQLGFDVEEWKAEGSESCVYAPSYHLDKPTNST
jgi:hypothetical protein